jgi:hypothetical protein
MKRLPTVIVGSLFALTAWGAREAPLNVDDPGYLRRQYAWFQSQNPARQQQIRRLNEEFLALPPQKQDRFTVVMQKYNSWLAGLSESNRERVIQSSPGERAKVVAQIKEEEWVASLSKADRDEIAQLDPDARRQRIKDLRTEITDRQEEWAIAQMAPSEFQQPGKIPNIFQNDRNQIEAFVVNLKTHLNDNERRSLEEAKRQADDHSHYLWYTMEIARLADLHPLLPGKPGIRDFPSLPEENRAALMKQGMRKKEDMRDFRRTAGRWPDFALEVARSAKTFNVKLPVPLGDCRKADMPPEVIKYLDTTLEPALKKTESGQADLKALEAAQGSWPEYPKMLMDLSKKYKQPVPGWSLPGPAQTWDRFRLGKNRPK